MASAVSNSRHTPTDNSLSVRSMSKASAQRSQNALPRFPTPAGRFGSVSSTPNRKHCSGVGGGGYVVGVDPNDPVVPPPPMRQPPFGSFARREVRGRRVVQTADASYENVMLQVPSDWIVVTAGPAGTGTDPL
jgi:hypothetical protein